MRALKSLGQHWLTDRQALSRIVEAAGLTDEETVMEVGAGTGLLTRLLARRASRLIAVEIDAGLAVGLRTAFGRVQTVSVVEADVTRVPVEELLRLGGGGMPYVVVGNLPYFIGTAIVRRFLYSPVPPRRLVVTLQQEVAESMAARPPRMTYLGVEAQLLSRPQLLFRIPPAAFRPPPKVWSAVLRLDVRDVAEVEVDDREAFLALARAGFAAPRKHLRNSLAIGLQVEPPHAEALLDEAGIDARKRPAELDLPDWKALYFAFRRSRARR